MTSPQEAGPNIQERLGSMGINPATLLLPEQVAVQQANSEILRNQEKIDEWSAAVESVHSDTAALRERLETGLRTDVESGRVQALGDAEKRVAQIDATVAKGPARSWTYNGYRGDKWHRSQTYYATVDEQGNIWGEFEEGRHEIGITGKPVSPGKHIIHHNPTLPESQR
jgi:hypothetical protein